MLSLYIHIPFCYHKCKYCSFFVLPENDHDVDAGGLEQLKTNYLASLLDENAAMFEMHKEKQIRTIYLGGGTPFQFGVERLWTLIDTLLDTWDCEFLEELSIELNPDPFDEVIDFIKQTQRRYKNVFRIRFSFGIQTFDDKILQASKRNYVFNNLIHRLREVVEIKENTTCYNLDFIAFGHNPSNLKSGHKELTTKEELDNWLPRDQTKRDFFTKVIKSQAFDGLSIYTLELFPGSEWYNEQKTPLSDGAILSDDTTIWSEFQWLKDTVMKAGYNRYEISNFALRGKRSLHNMVYRNMENYLGLGINSSGMLLKEDGALRYKNTVQWKQYLAGNWKDDTADVSLSPTEVLAEKFMLSLRTDQGVLLSTYESVLVKGVDEVVENLLAAGYCSYHPETTKLTLSSRGLDIYNTILLELLEKF